MAHRRSCISMIFLLFLCACSQSRTPTSTTPQLLLDDTGLYPRLLRLAHNDTANGHILASVVSFAGNNGMGLIFESTDGGVSFQRVGIVADPDAAGGQGLCCATLFELPRTVGSLAEGTLLWAASVGQDEPNRRMALRIWTSTDQGRTWAYLSNCALETSNDGLWEPEFSVAADGALVCHYSAETGGIHDQKIVRVRSYDGLNWVDAQDTVASSQPFDRPGMPIVRMFPDRTYFMSYEICPASGSYRCAAYYRRSPDGWFWGEPDDLGVRAETADGRYFAHAPNIAWGGRPQPKVFMVGQLLEQTDGAKAEGSGATIFRNAEYGVGTWKAVAAPVPIPEAYDNYCPNYSSALLPSEDGRSILELATRYDGQVCKAYFAIGPIE